MQYGLFTDEDFRQTTPFTDRVVCVLGNLGASPASVRKRILDFGASEVRTSVSRGAHYIVMGNDVPDSQLSVLASLTSTDITPKSFTGRNWTISSPDIMRLIRFRRRP